jgi:hypothetical protein
MRYVATILALTFVSAGCSASKRADAAKPEMTRCQEELKTIPEAAALSADARGKRPEISGQPLAGMEIALTINRMVRSKSDPDEDKDDWCYTENKRENFDKIVGALRVNGMPPTVDFVSGESFELDLQEEWLRSGNLIGTMPYRERAVKKEAAEEIISSIGRTEAALAPLWVKFERKVTYFRYPALKLGMDVERPRKIRAFLKQNSYIEVPATIDPRDDYFSQVYCAALARGDSTCASYVTVAFKSLLLDKTIRARGAALKISGHDVKHILMIGANQLTADLLDQLVKWYKAMGVRFISIDEALRDPFYATEDVTNRANEIIWETRRQQLKPDAEQ